MQRKTSRQSAIPTGAISVSDKRGECMSLQAVPSGERLHIGFFGRRNAGKSSVVNAVTGQEMAVVSDYKGTTTDPVQKAMDNVMEQEALLQAVAKKLNIDKALIDKFEIQKKSLDARKKPELFYVYSVTCTAVNEEKILKKNRSADIVKAEHKPYQFVVSGTKKCAHRPVIVGMGPAGLFCGYILAKHGYKPILLERGKRVEERTKDVTEFWNGGRLCLNSNVQFGEGGAGTFSDGKLNTLIKDKTGRNKEVLRILVENGAPQQILYDSKPHVGTDILSLTVANMRNQMLEWGADIRYESQVTDILVSDNKLTGLVINDCEQIDAENVVFALMIRNGFWQKMPYLPSDTVQGIRLKCCIPIRLKWKPRILRLDSEYSIRSHLSIRASTEEKMQMVFYLYHHINLLPKQV